MAEIVIPRVGARRRGLPLLLGLALLSTSAHCLFTGLDDYSSGGGRPQGDGGPPEDAPPDAPPPSDAGCDCGPAEACVLGACRQCTPTWIAEHKALRQGEVIITNHHLDRAARTLYVSSSRQDGQGPRRGYLAEVDTCAGASLAVSDGAMVEGKLVPGLLYLSPHQGSLYAKLQVAGEAVLGGYARYDPASHTFDRIVELPPFMGGAEGAWSFLVGPSGRAYWWGDWSTGTSTPLGMRATAEGKTCVEDYPAHVGGTGRAMTRSGKDIYAAVCMPVEKEVRVLRFDDTACDLAGCDCPVAEELPPLSLPGAANVMNMKVAGSVLLVAGFTMATDTDWSGFLAQYSFGAKQWSSVFTYDEGALAEGFSALDSDDSFVYAAGFRGYVYGDTTNTLSDVFVFPFPITAASTPQRIPVPAVRAAFALDLDGDGMILSGYSAASAADGRSVRCTLTGCP